MSGRRDSNPRPRPWQGRALPTELLSLVLGIAKLDRFLIYQKKISINVLSAYKSYAYCFSYLRISSRYESNFIKMNNNIVKAQSDEPP